MGLPYFHTAWVTPVYVAEPTPEIEQVDTEEISNDTEQAAIEGTTQADTEADDEMHAWNPYLGRASRAGSLQRNLGRLHCLQPGIHPPPLDPILGGLPLDDPTAATHDGRPVNRAIRKS